MRLGVIVLAAGKGKRMNSVLPKVLHPLAGISLLERVVNTARTLTKNIYVIHGNGGSKVREELTHLPVEWIEQKEQLGTGHAVQQALPHCKDLDRLLILYGDVPLISTETLKNLLAQTAKNALGIIVTEPEDPTGLGRIIRDKSGNIINIVEHKDADKTQLKIREINTGIMTASAEHFKKWLPHLKSNNRQKEFYLTDIVALAVEDGINIHSVTAPCVEEVQGINDRWELARLERYHQKNRAKQLALAGATIMDPTRLDIRGEDIEVAQDVLLDVNVVMAGKIRIGKNSQIGPNVYLKNVIIGDNVTILANSVIEDAEIADNCQVGPFARLRPGSVLKTGAKVGNFVEMKKTTLGPGSKAPHLTYLGDAVIGRDVNIGAGTITCNYDGVNKWPTTIADDVFIGSNSSLVAPIKIGKGATIGAGSTITGNAPAERLTIARSRQTTINKWKRPKRK